jgi:hypothetical protein
MTARVFTLPIPERADLSLREECEREAMLELRAFKRTRKLSVDRLALMLGTSGDSVKRWLRGECRIPGWVVKALQRFEAPASGGTHAPALVKANAAPLVDGSVARDDQEAA